jgi:hypothetical protein
MSATRCLGRVDQAVADVVAQVHAAVGVDEEQFQGAAPVPGYPAAGMLRMSPALAENSVRAVQAVCMKPVLGRLRGPVLSPGDPWADPVFTELSTLGEPLHTLAEHLCTRRWGVPPAFGTAARWPSPTSSALNKSVTR